MATLRATTASGAETANNASFTPTLPAHQAGDLLVIVVPSRWVFSGGTPAAIATPAGWTLVTTAQNTGASSGANHRLQLFSKVAASSSEAAPTLTPPATAATYRWAAYSYIGGAAVASTATALSTGTGPAPFAGMTTADVDQAVLFLTYVGSTSPTVTLNGTTQRQSSIVGAYYGAFDIVPVGAGTTPTPPAVTFSGGNVGNRNIGLTLLISNAPTPARDSVGVLVA